MNTPVDIRGILERAGADPYAPEGSQAWALSQVDAAVAELIDVAQLQVHCVNRCWYVVHADSNRTAWSNIGHSTDQAACEEANQALGVCIARIGRAA